MSQFQRKLASIQVIDSIDPHTNADALALATVLGWQIVVGPDMTAGQKVIFFEVDSYLPVDADWFPLELKGRAKKSKRFRIRTIKLRGELSQGLVLPVPADLADMEVGTDVTEHLQVIKYERPELTGKLSRQNKIKKGDTFPTDIIHKTNEYRIQSEPGMLTRIQDQEYYITVKMDGTSSTYFIRDGKLVVCSRNQIRSFDKSCPYWAMAKKYNLEEILLSMPHLAIQGEICGPNIQKNLSGLEELQLFIFNVVDLRTKYRIPFDQMQDICTDLKLTSVPLYECGNRFGYATLPELLQKARGKYPGTDNDREGLVIRSWDGKISFKVINNDYLL